MYRRMTYTDRLHIERLYNSGKSIRYIASVLGFAPSSVHYELQHGFYDGLCGDTWETVRRYSADLAQRHSDFQVTAKGRPVKLGREYAYARSVAEKIRAGFSPDSIVGRFRLENRWTVSTTTLYRYIDSGYIPGISNQDLWGGVSSYGPLVFRTGIPLVIGKWIAWSARTKASGSLFLS